MANNTSRSGVQNNGTRFTMNTSQWPPERWAAVIVIASLVLLILIRRGFRGVSFMGANVNVS